MRIPLGLPMQPEPELASAAMGFLVGGAPGFVPKSRLKGLQLIATDADRTWLAGQPVRGTMADLLMTLSGRPAVLDRLSGPGAEVVAARI